MDENHIHIGNRVLIAPNVQFYTATHPVDFMNVSLKTGMKTQENYFSEQELCQ